jgi:cytochrome c oxidase assembly protein subunit 15
MVSRLRARLEVTPRQYRLVANLTLVALSLIVLTGVAVRLTQSGLGCSNWPKCGSTLLPPLSYHAVIEFGNRVVGALVGVVTAAAVVFAFTRRPYRRDLAWLSLTLPVGVIVQAVLGGLTVKGKLAPGWVISHFAVSMVILIGAFALAWRAAHEPGSRPRSNDRLGVWAVRALLPLGALTIAAGTIATASGPHSGGSAGQHILRLHFRGADTLTWVVHRHAVVATLFGIAVIATWLLFRHRGASEKEMEPLTVLGILLAAQGLVGAVQYEFKLPADMVWIHVSLATATWVTVLWAVAAAGRLVPRTSTVPVAEAGAPAGERALVAR